MLLDEPTYPGVWVSCRTVGVSWIGTDKGREAKLLCVPEADPAYADVHDLEDLPKHVRQEVGQFFEVYKTLDAAADVTDEGREGAEAARAVLEQAQQRYREQQD